MLRTCVHHGNYQEALNLFQRMQWDVEPNPALILDALRAYVATGNLNSLNWINAYVIERDF